MIGDRIRSLDAGWSIRREGKYRHDQQTFADLAERSATRIAVVFQPVSRSEVAHGFRGAIARTAVGSDGVLSRQPVVDLSEAGIPGSKRSATGVSVNLETRIRVSASDAIPPRKPAAPFGVPGGVPKSADQARLR